MLRRRICLASNPDHWLSLLTMHWVSSVVFKGFSMSFYFRFCFGLSCFYFTFYIWYTEISSSFLYWLEYAWFNLLESCFHVSSKFSFLPFFFHSSLFKTFLVLSYAYVYLIYFNPPFSLPFSHVPSFMYISVSSRLYEMVHELEELFWMCNLFLVSEKKKDIWGHKLVLLPQHQFLYAQNHSIQQKWTG